MSFRKFLVLAAQGSISLSLLSYLGYQAWRDDTFRHLIEAPKDWTQLAAAWFVALLAVVLTLTRWHVLVRALDLPLSLRDALRIGFVAYFTNLLAFGVVGGDTLKAVYLGQRVPGRRAEAVTTVLLDRVIGLYVLMALSAAGLYFFRQEGTAEVSPIIARVGQGAVIFTICGTIGLGLLFTPGVADARIWNLLEHVPLVGGIFKQLVTATRIYRQKYLQLAITLVMSLVIHSLYVLVFFLLAGGLGKERPSLATHVVIVPPAMAAGSLPIGTQEVVLDSLYRAALPHVGRQGFILILAFRVIQILISGVGILFYLGAKREVDELMEARSGPLATETIAPPKSVTAPSVGS